MFTPSGAITSKVRRQLIGILPDDTMEVKQIKSMVEGMKDELERLKERMKKLIDMLPERLMG